MCVSLCVHVCSYIYVYMGVCAYMCMHSCVHMSIGVYVHACIGVCMLSWKSLRVMGVKALWLSLRKEHSLASAVMGEEWTFLVWAAGCCHSGDWTVMWPRGILDGNLPASDM